MRHMLPWLADKSDFHSSLSRLLTGSAGLQRIPSGPFHYPTRDCSARAIDNSKTDNSTDHKNETWFLKPAINSTQNRCHKNGAFGNNGSPVIAANGPPEHPPEPQVNAKRDRSTVTDQPQPARNSCKRGGTRGDVIGIDCTEEFMGGGCHLEAEVCKGGI